MSLLNSSTLLITLTIWLVLLLSNVSESDGSRLHIRNLKSSQHGESHGLGHNSLSHGVPKGHRSPSPSSHARRAILESTYATPQFDKLVHSPPTSSSNSPSNTFIPPISPSEIQMANSPTSPSPSTSTANPPNPSTNPPSPHTSSIAPTISPSNHHSSSSPNSPISPSTPSTTTLSIPPTSPSSTPPLNPPTTNNPSLLVSPTPPARNSSGLQVGFYKGLCPNNMDVEATITTKVQEHFRRDPTLLPALLRLQFHDCFVHGCDASILIDQVDETLTEKNAGPNLSVRGYEFIDDLKDAAEANCPGVVSCADIIAIATKELMKLGGGVEFSVQTGRRDGRISKAEDVRLPSPFGPVSHSLSAFHAKNFTPEEMIVLFGCHTVGISHCVFFQDRLYNETSLFDPEMDSDLHEELVSTCPQGTTTNKFTFLDQNPRSSNKLDNSFFIQILNRRGILPIDQALVHDGITHHLVRRFAENPALFNARLATVMVKLQALDVLTGNQGEIRKVCNKVN